MNVRRVVVMLAIAAGLVGCGAKPDGTTPDGGSGGTANLDGVWTGSKVEVSPAAPEILAEEAAKFAVTIKGNHITAQRKGEAGFMYAVFDIDTSVTPSVITFTLVNEKGDASPRQAPDDFVARGLPLPPPPPGRLELGQKLKGIIRFDGDTAVVAICPAPDASPPTEFAPKAAAKTWGAPDATPVNTIGIGVIHLARQKEAPAWLNEPVPLPTDPDPFRPWPTVPASGSVPPVPKDK